MRAAIAVAKQAKKSPEFFAVLDRQTRKALLPPDTQALFLSSWVNARLSLENKGVSIVTERLIIDESRNS